MVEQKSFCESLAEFMDGVMVTVVDEVEGLLERDLGEMLREYNQHCVVGPQLSLERAPRSMFLSDESVRHGIASLLGIFGNLMTCTVAHYLIISPMTDSFDEDNTAGDDGLVLEHDYAESALDTAIGFIGEWEPTKTFQSTDPACICLKRPLSHKDGSLLLKPSIIPPTLVTCVTYLSGEEVDSRFLFPNLDDMSLHSRINVVGVDLLRFLRSAFLWRYDNISFLTSIYKGYRRLANRILSRDVETYSHNSVDILWPVSPDEYDFLSCDPFEVWCSLYAGIREVIDRDLRPIAFSELREVGDKVRGNSSQKWVLLEKLGYVVRQPVRRILSQEESYNFLMCSFFRIKLDPQMYEYTVVRDIPECFHFD